MPFNVNQFRSSFFSSGEPTSPAAFEVRIIGFPAVLPSSIARDLVYRCEGASIPSKTIQTVDRRTHGAIRKVAYGATYEEITLSFIVSSEMAERNFFSAWQSWIIDSSEGGDISYYDDYVGRIQIVTYDHKGNENLSVTLVEAYPTNVNAVALNWGEKNSYMKLDVTFVYHYWVDAAGAKQNGLNAILGALGQSFQFINNLKQLRNQLRSGNSLQGRLSALASVAVGGIGLLDSATKISPSIGNGVSQVAKTVSNQATKLGNSFKEATTGLISKARSLF